MLKNYRLILHGDNIVASRKRLSQLIDQAKSDQQQIVQLEAQKLTPALLEQTLSATSLFGEEKLIIIEGLHSLPRSHRKQTLIQLLAANASNTNSSSWIVWEKRNLSKTMLKKFPRVKAEEFKVNQKLWQFLDNLGSDHFNLDQQLKLLTTVCQQEDVHFVFLMIIRQIRLLIQAKEGHFSGAPFTIVKLRKQVHNFSLTQLLKLHQQLFLIESRLKQSHNLLDLKSELDLWLIYLYK